MKCILNTVVVLMMLLSSCVRDRAAEKNFWEDPVQTDLEDIIKRGTLRAVVDNSSTSYYIYRGRRMGYEFEMLRHLSERLGVQLKLVVTDDIDRAIELLAEGKADIIAMNLELSEERRLYANFTDATNSISTVLVQRLEDEVMIDISQLEGKTVHLRQGSVYRERLEALRD